VSEGGGNAAPNLQVCGRAAVSGHRRSHALTSPLTSAVEPMDSSVFRLHTSGSGTLI
jgi:hypothetical protein